MYSHTEWLQIKVHCGFHATRASYDCAFVHATSWVQIHTLPPGPCRIAQA